MNKKLFYNSIFLILSFSLLDCSNKAEAKHEKSDTVQAISSRGSNESLLKGKVHYKVNDPVKCLLSKELVEISALTLDSVSGNIFSINDEKGIIYEVKDCEVVDKNKFGKNGDYEGIEIVGDQIYALKSNGKIVQYDRKLKKRVKEIKNPLTLSNDAEGLGYDTEKGLLLIACKGSPNIKKNQKLKKTKSVYAYNVKEDEFISDPLFLIKDDDIQIFFEKNINKNWSKKQTKKRLQRALDFSPSGIARNPVDRNYYLISTVGKSLIVLNENNEIVDLMYLDHKAYIQPEGICFDTQGNMYISNEGKGLQSNILTITY